MAIIRSKYLGDGQTELTHSNNDAIIITDLPPDNGGQGRTFSPTDLFAASISSCILSVMSIMAERDGVDLKGMTIDVEKIMQQSPRKVKELNLIITYPESLNKQYRDKYMAAVRACPVHRSIDPELHVNVTVA